MENDICLRIHADGSAVLLQDLTGASEWTFHECQDGDPAEKECDGGLSLSNCFVAKDGFSGKGLFAKVFIAAGEEIFQEDPLLLVNGQKFWQPDILEKVVMMCNEVTSIAPFQLKDAIRPDVFLPVLSFQCMPKRTKQKVLALFCPETEKISPLLNVALNVGVEKLQNLDLLPQGDDSRTESIKVILIFLANAFQVFRDVGADWEGDMAVYQHCCRLNHSCLPNCWWAPVSGKRKGCISVRALVHIKPGEELSQSYLEEERWRPTFQRRLVLEDTKFFSCVCQRCAAKVDACRGFHCPCCQTGTLLMPNNNQVDILGSLVCKTCKQKPGTTWISNTLEFERCASESVERLNAEFQTMTSIDPLIKLFINCKDTMTQHWVLALIHDLMHDLYKFEGSFDQAAFHLYHRIQIMEKIYPRLSNKTGWLYEFLGDDIAASQGIQFENEPFDASRHAYPKIMPAFNLLGNSFNACFGMRWIEKQLKQTLNSQQNTGKTFLMHDTIILEMANLHNLLGENLHDCVSNWNCPASVQTSKLSCCSCKIEQDHGRAALMQQLIKQIYLLSLSILIFSYKKKDLCEKVHGLKNKNNRALNEQLHALSASSIVVISCLARKCLLFADH